MMKRYFKLFISFLVLAFTLLCVGITTTNTEVVAASYDSYYANVDTSSGQNLIASLHSIISSGTKDLGYNGLLSAYKTTDCKPGTNIIWDMYSNEEFVCGGPKENHQYSKEGDGYNREHSIPQSWFNEKSPMKSDLFHVYPTDGYVNNRRSNYPYGEVGSATYTSKNGSKLGSSSFTGYSGTVFEPIDEYKGDFARTYFYMATRYSNLVGNWGSGASTVFKGSYPYLTSYAVNLFTKWAKEDPVSEKETARNDAVQSLQKNRNPFIDHPEYIDQIWGTNTTPTTVDQTKIDNAVAKINLIPTNVTLECKQVVLDAQAAYNACSANEKTMVSNAAKLTNAINIINRLENPTVSSNEKEYIIPTEEFAYTKDKKLTISGDEFSFNCAGGYTLDSGKYELRVGGNKNNVCKANSKFNLGSINAGEMYMNFDVENASKISFNVTNRYQVDNWYIFFSADQGTTYTKVSEGKGTDSTYQTELSTPTTGRFALVVTAEGNGAPRTVIDMFTITTGSGSTPVTLDFNSVTTNLNLSVKYTLDTDGNLVSASSTVNAIAHLSEAIEGATYSVIYTKSSNITKCIEEYYENETVEALATKVSGSSKAVTLDGTTLKANIGNLTENYTIVFVINVNGKLYFTSQTTNNTKNMIKYYLDNNLISNEAYKLALQYLA